jgi:hypothetical protein
MDDAEDRMVSAAGPFYTTPALARWLDVPPQTLDDRVRNRQLLGLPSREGPLFYPAAQFLKDRTTVPGLEKVLDTLAVGVNDPWAWSLWLAGSTQGEGGPTGWQLLRRGDADTGLAAARSTADSWSH